MDVGVAIGRQLKADRPFHGDPLGRRREEASGRPARLRQNRNAESAAEELILNGLSRRDLATKAIAIAPPSKKSRHSRKTTAVQMNCPARGLLLEHQEILVRPMRDRSQARRLPIECRKNRHYRRTCDFVKTLTCAVSRTPARAQRRAEHYSVKLIGFVLCQEKFLGT